MANTRILLVEDDEDDYVIARDVLQDIGFLEMDLVRAANAEDAFDYIKEDSFDLCLLDFHLGALNGIDILRKARSLGFSAPIIMLTGQADNRLDEQALDAGAADYLNKSEIGTGRFIRAIRYALARRDVEQERVQRLKAQAENESKNRFLAHLSHELRTPLTSILGYTELLLNSEKGAEATAELDVIFRNGKHLLNLLNDMLDLSKIAADKLEINSSRVNLNSLIIDVYTLLRVSAIDKGLTISLNSATPIPAFITTDATRFRQILINVISNAIKFTDQGEVAITIGLEEKTDRERLVVTVKDTGIGIPADKVDEIFSPFTQVADVVSKSVGGSGLGLAISTTLAEKLGGSIHVESEIGQGSCFTVTIDPGDIDEEPREWLNVDTHDKAVGKKLERSLSGKVLVVDDLRDIRSLVGHIIARSGAKVEYAANGKRAIDQVVAADKLGEPFDLVLMDIHMPEMDGKTAVSQLRAQGYTLPVVALTAASMRGSFEQLEACGFTNMLSKPVDIDKLFKVLCHFLSPAESMEPVGGGVPPSKRSGSLQLLLVEDDTDAADAVTELLGHLGGDVYAVPSVNIAYESLEHNRWDAVLVDKNLNDGTGFDVANKILERGISTYVVMVSGDQIEQAEINRYGLDEVLLKPLQLSALQDLLTNIRKYNG